MRLKLTLILLLTLILPLISADLGTFQQDTCVDIKTILNATSVNISTINYPNSSVAVSNAIMSKSGQTFNYTFCDTGAPGVYIYDYFDNLNNVYVNSFEITYTGTDIDNATSMMYLGILTVLILFMWFVIWFINKLPSENKRDEEGRIIQISWLKYLRSPLWGLIYLLVWAILWFSANLAIAYLGGFIGNLLFAISMVMGWCGIPIVIIWGLKIFDNIRMDVKVQGYLKRGIDADA
jgi:hypothetical protein